MTTKPKPEPKPEHEDTILSSPTTIEIEGHTYTLRRLGLRDVFRVSRILGRGVGILGDLGPSITPGQAAQVIVASMSVNEEEVMELLASVLDLKVRDLEDTSRFPMPSILTIVKALVEGQDMKEFFDRLSAMMEEFPEMQTASQESSKR